VASAASSRISPSPTPRIGLFCPTLPPARGGLPDHTRSLALALAARGADAVVLGRTGNPELLRPVPVMLGVRASAGPNGLLASARRAGVEAFLVQYVPFLYARFGIAPRLAIALRRIRDAGIRLAVFVHEPYVPFTRLPWLLTGWPMRWQFRAVVGAADLVYSPVPAFLELARKAARAGAMLRRAPTGSNIPVTCGSRQAAREALGLEDGEVAVGVFSPGAAGLRRQWLIDAAAGLPAQPAVRWVFFGGGEAPPEGFPGSAGIKLLGWLDANAASEVFRALDVAAGPFEDGLTLRRGSAMAALAHGVALASSRGPLFDPELESAALCAATAADFAAGVRTLVGDPVRREALARRGRAWYEAHGSADVFAAQLLADLGAS